MMLKTKKLHSKADDKSILTYTATLEDGARTTIHVVRYRRDSIKARLVSFPQETRLLDWCQLNGINEAFGGGYFLREKNQPLGELWLAGSKQPTAPFAGGRNKIRGSVMLDQTGIQISPRNHLPDDPEGDLLQAGPTLVHLGVSIFLAEADPEGFSDTAEQHDEDINAKRHPRAAIGYNDNFLFTVTADGRSADDAGLFLQELAEIFLLLGATEAVNLDGGRSSTQISDGKLINKPRKSDEESAMGYPIFNAIAIENA